MKFTEFYMEEIVSEEHPLRKIDKLISFQTLGYRIKPAQDELGRKGYGLEIGLRCLFLQFYYDLSDREFENYLRDSIAGRWFCKLPLEEETPDHTFMSRLRKKIGAETIGKIFRTINNRAEENGHIGKVFSFVDSTTIKTKEATWEERDKSKEENVEKLNNDNISKFSADPDARYGCKGKDKFWFGYKGHVLRDMKQGLITKVLVTPANVSDSKVFPNLCPRQGMVFGDKGYATKLVFDTLKQNECHSGIILKNNMQEKNKDKDRWLARVRSPFEDFFSKRDKRARYRTKIKVLFQTFMEAIIYNVKRLTKIHASPIFTT